MNRRDFLANSGLVVAGAVVGPRLDAPLAALRRTTAQADYTVRIAPLALELAPGCVVHTTAFNGCVPGPVIRMQLGRPITVDVVNETAIEDIVHWHGLIIPSNVDGSTEEGTPPVPPGSTRRYSFTPQPAGFRWYHTHIRAGHDLNIGTYAGEFGCLMIDAPGDPGRYDQEIFLVLHDWKPYEAGGDDGYRFVMYNRASINGRLLGFDDPIRVRQGERVLFHILNASASEPHWLSLPGHAFMITALDGNSVPAPAPVETLRMGPGERIDAVVTMDRPGVWILGECHDHIRAAGMGIVVEYEGRPGPARWEQPRALTWDYAAFEAPHTSDVNPAAVPTQATGAARVPMAMRSTFHGHGDFEHWSINGEEFPRGKPIMLTEGGRYRLLFQNRSNDDHPLHLHRHRFELVSLDGRPTRGVLKDVVIVPAFTTTEVEFTADNPGKTLFHCHNQEHMDFGFMKLFDYA